MAAIPEIPEAVNAITNTVASAEKVVTNPAVASPKTDPTINDINSAPKDVSTASTSSKADTGALPAIPPSLFPNVGILQSFPFAKNTSPPKTEGDASFNTQHFDFSKDNQGTNLMSSIKDYFNQPVSNRSDPTTQKTSFDQNSKNDLLSTAFFGPRLSVSPTLNFNSNNGTSQRSTVDTGSVRQNF